MQRAKIFRFAPLLAVALLGCDGASKESFDKQHSHVRAIAAQYMRASSKLGHNPRDEQEFKKALASLKIPLPALNVNSIDELFISERDHEPLVVVYGSPPKGSDVVVYEKTGIDGKHYAGHMIGMVEELDQEELTKALGQNEPNRRP